MSWDKITEPREEVDGLPESKSTPQAGRLSINEAFRVLSHPQRRKILRYLMNRPHETVAVNDLVDCVVGAEVAIGSRHRNRERVRAGVQHNHLPKLTEAGLVASEADTNQVRYQGEARLEALLQCVDDLYQNR